MICYSQTRPGLSRRSVTISLAVAALLFFAPAAVVYEFQANGFGAIIRSLIMNAFSPVWWALILVAAHAGRQLFRYYNPSQRAVAIDAFFRSYIGLYAFTLGVFFGYVGGSLDRFMESREVMEHGNALHAELSTQKQTQGAINAHGLLDSPAFIAAQEEGLRVQVLSDEDSWFAISEADLTVFVEENRFMVVVPFDLPYFLMSGAGSSRIFLRKESDEYWSKRYLKLHVGQWVEISEHA